MIIARLDMLHRRNRILQGKPMGMVEQKREKPPKDNTRPMPPAKIEEAIDEFVRDFKKRYPKKITEQPK